MAQDKEDKSASAGDKATEEPAVNLDALKALSDSAFRRWEKRRNYEWLLSISIWAAIAAFSSLVLNKQFSGQNRQLVARWVLGLGITGALMHFWYLWLIATHTLADVYIQTLAERQMYKTGVGRLMSPEDEKRSYPGLHRYGLLQAAITLILVGVAYCAIDLQPAESPSSKDQMYQRPPLLPEGSKGAHREPVNDDTMVSNGQDVEDASRNLSRPPTQGK